jgi:hypothetical protein
MFERCGLFRITEILVITGTPLLEAGKLGWSPRIGAIVLESKTDEEATTQRSMDTA